MDNKTQNLLAWYDKEARDLPWRVSPADRARGVMPDPYKVWLSEIMLQQTTVASVKAYFTRFVLRWPTVQDLAKAEDADVMAEWAGLGYYARARNLLKCARVVADLGAFPDTEDGLRELPGIGPYTAAAVAAIAFDRPAAVMDGNVERVMSRIYAVLEPLPSAKKKLYARALAMTPESRAGDYAQAVMDLGATVCTPRNPSCHTCPLRGGCAAFAQGIAADLPRKMPKAVKPERIGAAFVVRREDGAILLETRPKTGLLGGMLCFPTGPWAVKPLETTPPMDANWQEAPKVVTHVFTHFKLSLTVFTAHVAQDSLPANGFFEPAATFDVSALPTVMRKVFDVAHPHLEVTCIE